jgi:protein-S-isoprenylcysteine O-methyltransferase Ste14
MGWFVAFAAPWCLFALWWAARAIGTAKSLQRESISSTLRHRLLFAAGSVLLAYTPHALSYPLWDVSFELAVTALAIEWLGIAFAIWAREHLGRLWSGRITFKEGHRIVKSGPYRLVRHPIYTGILVGVAAVVMVRGTLSAVIALFLFVVGVTIKLLAEERLMTEQFGDEYREYKREVKALIPFLI